MAGRRFPRSKAARERESAIAAAVRLLAYSSRTEQEISAALLRRGYEPREVDEAVSEMKRLGYVDDESAAQRWAENAAADSRWGVAGIARRLAGRGIDPDLAHQAAKRAYDGTGKSEYDVALELATKRVGARSESSPEEREREMRRLAGFLQRRGFGAETIARVLRELF